MQRSTKNTLYSNAVPSIETGNILQHISDAVIATDNNFVVTTFNKAAEEIYGFVASEIIGRPLISHIKYSYPDTTESEALQHLQKHGCWQGKVLVSRKDGTVLQLLADVKFIQDSEGRRAGVVAVNKNITQLAEIEQRSKLTSLRLGSILNGTTEALFLVDANYRLLLFNDKAIVFIKKFLGIELEQGCGFIDIFPPHRRAVIRKAIDKALAGENSEYEVHYPPHLWALLNYSGIANDHGEIKEICISSRDITHRKKAEEEVKILSLLAKETENGVMITDANDNISWTNESFLKIYGYSGNELIGQHPKIVFAGPETDLRTVQQIDEHVRNGQHFTCELASYNKRGEKLWVRLNMQPVFNDEKMPVKYFVMLTDLTEQLLQKQNEIRSKVEQQKQINRIILKTQEQLSNELGRELHDNINQILTAAKLQIEFGNSGANADQNLIQNGVNNIEKAIDEIRALSRQLVAPFFAESDLLPEINNLIESMRLTDRVQLDTLKFDGTELTAECKLHIFRILQEQLKNISKHARASSIHIVIENDKEKLRMTIKDNGVGFDVKERKKGVGLKSIRSRVESYNGFMEVVSSPGEGCKLTVTFPLHQEH